MFTTKYVTFARAAKQDPSAHAPTFYNRHEQVTGDFALISQEVDDDGDVVVHAHRHDGAPGYTWFSVKLSDAEKGQPPAPRPTLYVMNESGATVAKYDL